MPWYELILRVVLSFLTLFAMTRIMGRKELSQMTFFNFVSAISIGSITANFVLSPNVTILNGVLALVGWTAFTIAMGIIDIKSIRGRMLVQGTPIVLIQNGRVLEQSLRKARLDLDALRVMLRQKNVFSFMDVEYAIFETSGRLSVLKKPEKQSLTKGDMQIQVPTPIFPIAAEVISDGRIRRSHMEKLKLDDAWLNQQLQKAGVQDVSDVFVAEVQSDGSLHIDHRSEQVH